MRLRSYFWCVLLLWASAQSQPMDSLQSAFARTDLTDTTRVLRLSKQIFDRAPNAKQRFEVLERLSEMYFRAGNMNQSIAYAFQAKTVAERSNDAEMMARAYGSIANQYSYLNLSDKARPYLNRAIAQIQRLPAGDNQHRLRALALLEMGKLDFNNGDYNGANRNFKQSLQQFDRVTSLDRTTNYHYRRALYNIGNSYYYLKAPDSAENYLVKSLKINDVKNPDLKYFIYSTLAEVYTLRGQHKRAIDTLQAVLNDRQFSISPLKAEIYLNLARNFERIGDKANYALYNEKHLTLRDSVEGHERRAIGAAFNVEQKDLSESVNASREQVTWLLYALLAVAVCSVAAVVYLIRKKKKEHAIYLSVIEKLQKQADLSAPEIENVPEREPGVRPAPAVPQQATTEILAGLQQFERELGFRNPKLTVAALAVQLDTNPAYLSAVIKTHKGKNFNNYVNELRIGYICQKIHTQRDYANYKISFLAEDSGFVSHSAFSTIFKKVTGISPSVFLAEEEKRNQTREAESV